MKWARDEKTLRQPRFSPWHGLLAPTVSLWKRNRKSHPHLTDNRPEGRLEHYVGRNSLILAAFPLSFLK